MELTEIIISILAVLSGLIPIVLIGALIFFLIRKNNDKPGTDKPEGMAQVISFQNLFRLYLYVIVSISAFVLLFGLASLGRVGLGLIDRNLSYGYESAGEDYSMVKENINPVEPKFVCYDEKMTLVKIEGKNYCQNDNAIKTDLVNGAVITISMLIIFVAHLVLLLNQEYKKPTPNIKKIFVFGNLIVYSVMSLVVLPVSLYQLFNYLIFQEKPVLSYDAPGGIVAFAVFSLISWICWLTVMIKVRDAKKQ